MSTIEDDEPITLKEACLLFPRSKLTVCTLRAEAARGRLDIFRLGKRDCTTPKAMREMVEKCRAAENRRDFTLIRGGNSGLSETERASSALARANESVARLKNTSRNTSATSTSPNLRARQ